LKHLPIQRRWRRLRRLHHPRVTTRLNKDGVGHVPEPLVLDNLYAILEVRPASLLAAHLDNPLGFLRGLKHLQSRRQSVGYRLLDVHIFACRTRLHHHRRVPVVWSGDQNRIDVLAFQDAPVVAI
jgi:hypothetical protein